jgi:thiol-disulfide isomerase/thioredoxin
VHAVRPTAFFPDNEEDNMTYPLPKYVSTLVGSFLLFVACHAGAAPTIAPLPDNGPVPELVGVTGWLNSPPLTLAALRGKVVLVEFWTYSCSNCLANLPYVSRWHSQYKDSGLAVLGIHTPEFPFEKDAGNVAAAVKRLSVHYPVVQDNRFATWTAFSNKFWPAVYLIDRKGHIRYSHFGEGQYGETDQAIRQLLAEK